MPQIGCSGGDVFTCSWLGITAWSANTWSELQCHERSKRWWGLEVSKAHLNALAFIPRFEEALVPMSVAPYRGRLREHHGLGDSKGRELEELACDIVE